MKELCCRLLASPFLEGVMPSVARLISCGERQPAGSYRPAEPGGPFGMKMKKRKRPVMMKTAKTRKKKKTITAAKSERMAQEKIFIYIPGDIISEILLRLPARSLGKFKCVSKSWLSIISNTAFVRANAQHSLITRGSLFIGESVEHDDTPSIKSYLAFAESTSESVNIRLQPLESIPLNRYAVASCDGLVCLCRYGHFQHFVVFNHLTGHAIPLPKDNDGSTYQLGFYFHRPTSKYRILKFMHRTHGSQVLVVGETSWRYIPINIPKFFYYRNPLELNGNLYWLAFTRAIGRLCKVPPDIVVIFDEEEEVYSSISLPPSEKLQDVGGNLVNFNGELGLWVVGVDYTIDIWIMKSFWIKRYSVNYAHIDNRPSPFTAALSLGWILGRAISIVDEELLFDLSKIREPHYLLRWNLKSGACVVRNLIDHSTPYRFTFPYIETLTNPQYSAST